MELNLHGNFEEIFLWIIHKELRSDLHSEEVTDLGYEEPHDEEYS